MGSSHKQSPHIRPPRLIQRPTRKDITIDLVTYERLRHCSGRSETFTHTLNRLMDVYEGKHREIVFNPLHNGR